MNSQTTIKPSRFKSRNGKGLSQRDLPFFSGVAAEDDGNNQKLDPFCVDRNLKSWASSRVVSRGMDYYRKGRVTAFESFEEADEDSKAVKHRIAATVEGAAEQPYRVEIELKAEGIPASRCSCPFNWEPLCKHAAAALLAWQQKETGSEPNIGAAVSQAAVDSDDRERYILELAEIEIKLRRDSAQQQGLKIVDKPKSGILGAYAVSSGNPDRGGSRYEVIVRDDEWRHASCRCIDFMANELGTCKHIERVRAYLSAKPRAAQLAQAVRKSRKISAYFATRDSHRRTFSTSEHIRVYIPPSVNERLPEWFRRSFDAADYLIDTHKTISPKSHVEKLFKRLQSETGLSIEIAPRIAQALEADERQSAWERSVEETASPSSSAWRNSVGRMRIDLHPYQAEGIQFASKKRRAFIADDMGLGKTVQAIGTALLLKEIGAVRRALVISPASLKFQWKNEIEKVSNATVDIIAGSAKSRDEQYKKGRAFFTLINYELLYRDLDQVLVFEPDMVILDEAQRIKNWETKIAQTIKRLKCPFRLVLTGTPLENRLPELLSIAEFLNPRALGAPWKLIPTYAELGENDKIVGYTDLDRLRERLSKFLIRRTRHDVLSQLPKRTDNHYWTPLTPEQRDVHDELERSVSRLLDKWKKFKRLTREDIERLMLLLNCMRIVSNAYGQYDWKSIEREVLTTPRLSCALKKKIGSPKLDEFYKVISELLENPGQKVVVFSQWERMLRLAELYIRDILVDAGARSVIFCGALSQKKRAEEVSRFLEDPSTRVFFSTDAGGVGLNLQHGANCVVNLDVPWNPAVLEQRIGRVYRMGQKKSVQAIHFVSAECAEEKIFGLVAQKKALFAGIFSEDVREVKFTANQAASFIEKMKMIVPDGAASKEKTSQSENETVLAQPGASPEQLLPAAAAVSLSVPATPNISTTGNALEAAAQDSVAKVAAQSSNPPAIDVDLSPVFSALSGLVPALRDAASSGGASEGFKLRISHSQEGVHLTLPKAATDLLKGLLPLVQAMAKLN